MSTSTTLPIGFSDAARSYETNRAEQKRLLAELAPANAELKRLQAVKAAEKAKETPDEAFLAQWKKDFRIAKDAQLKIVYDLADVNGELHKARAVLKQAPSKKGKAK